MPPVDRDEARAFNRALPLYFLGLYALKREAPGQDYEWRKFESWNFYDYIFFYGDKKLSSCAEAMMVAYAIIVNYDDIVNEHRAALSVLLKQEELFSTAPYAHPEVVKGHITGTLAKLYYDEAVKSDREKNEFLREKFSQKNSTLPIDLSVFETAEKMDHKYKMAMLKRQVVFKLERTNSYLNYEYTLEGVRVAMFVIKRRLMLFAALKEWYDTEFLPAYKKSAEK